MPLSLSCARRVLQHLVLLWVVSLLAACASLPEVGYLLDRDLAPARDPTIVSARGTLPDGRTQALLGRLEDAAGATAILQRHVAAEEAIVGRPLVAGNKVALLDDGPLTMRAMMAAVRGAVDHINLETYIFENDAVGQQLADLLIAKRTQGVKVNLIYDSVGNIDVPPEFFTRMRAAGIRTLEFNPVNPLKAREGWDVNQRDHRKLLVVDGKIAFTGGVNISAVYGKSSILDDKPKRKPPPPSTSPPSADEAAWRDTHMQIEGPVVADFQRLFLDTWERKTGLRLDDAQYFPALKPQGKALVRAIGSTPEQNDYTIYKTYLSALTYADRTAYLTTAYFVPDRQVLRALTEAARRGVDVRIIFPSFTDHGPLLTAARSFYEELLQAGVRVYERKSAMLHAKTAVIDGVWSTIGSTNLDMRSFLHNDEINAVVLDPDFAQQMEALFQRDLRESREITAEAWAQRGLSQRLKEWAVRLFDYWL